jgi:hypothetical protein
MGTLISPTSRWNSSKPGRANRSCKYRRCRSRSRPRRYRWACGRNTRGHSCPCTRRAPRSSRRNNAWTKGTVQSPDKSTTHRLGWASSTRPARAVAETKGLCACLVRWRSCVQWSGKPAQGAKTAGAPRETKPSAADFGRFRVSTQTGTSPRWRAVRLVGIIGAAATDSAYASVASGGSP